MNFKLRRNVTAIAAVATAAFAGGAYAATQSSQSSPRQALLDDAAKRLNVTPAQLSGALQGAFLDQLHAAVAAGRLTQAQADMIKQDMQDRAAQPGLFGHESPGFGGLQRGFALPVPGFGPARARPGGRLAAAASYLSLSPQQLFNQLAGGKSLAMITKARGRSLGGLKAAMLAAIHTQLDRAVSGKLITAAQAQQILKRLPARLDEELNRPGLGMHRGGFKDRPGEPSGRTGGPMMPPPGPASLAGGAPGVPGPAY